MVRDRDAGLLLDVQSPHFSRLWRSGLANEFALTTPYSWRPVTAVSIGNVERPHPKRARSQLHCHAGRSPTGFTEQTSPETPCSVHQNPPKILEDLASANFLVLSLPTAHRHKLNLNIRGATHSFSTHCCYCLHRIIRTSSYP